MWLWGSTIAGITVFPVRFTRVAPARGCTSPWRPTRANRLFSTRKAEVSITRPSPVMSRAPSNSVVSPPAGPWPAESHADAARNNRATASFAFRTDRIRPPRGMFISTGRTCQTPQLPSARVVEMLYKEAGENPYAHAHACRDSRDVCGRDRRRNLDRRTPGNSVGSVGSAGQRLRGRTRRDWQPGSDGAI